MGAFFCLIIASQLRNSDVYADRDWDCTNATPGVRLSVETGDYECPDGSTFPAAASFPLECTRTHVSARFVSFDRILGLNLQVN